MFFIKRVYYFYTFTTMQHDFVTGLKLRNSLSNNIVTYLTNYRKPSPQWMVRTLNGIHVDQLYIPTVIWVMQGTTFIDIL
jgi:hypothetical protein